MLLTAWKQKEELAEHRQAAKEYRSIAEPQPQEVGYPRQVDGREEQLSQKRTCWDHIIDGWINPGYALTGELKIHQQHRN